MTSRPCSRGSALHVNVSFVPLPTFLLAILLAMLVAVSCSPSGNGDAEPAEADSSEAPRGLRVDEAGATGGYVLYSPLVSSKTYLIDQEGQVVHMWSSEWAPGAGVYLLDNGNLLRSERVPDFDTFTGGGQGGVLREVTWDGEVVWKWTFASDDGLLHHDVEQLPNGNILAIAWESKSADEARRAGRAPNRIPEKGIWPDMVLEIEPLPPDDARIVWEWHAWDHLVQDVDPDLPNYGDPSEHLGRIDINGDQEPTSTDEEELEALRALGYVDDEADEEELFSDLFHTNAVDYNAELDQIALSTPRFGEIWILDHSTTTEEAKGSSGGRQGRGGDLLYRWGNANAYGRATSAPKQLFGQHDVRWIEEGLPGAGNLLIFNNNRPGPEKDGEETAYSEVLEIVPPTDESGAYAWPETGAFGPAEPVWTYSAPDSFHSNFVSGAHRLPNGNTLVTMGNLGRFFEVTPSSEIVWEYWTPYSGDVRNSDGSPPHPVNEREQNATFRATKILSDHPALAGRALEPLDPQPPIEIGPWPEPDEEDEGEEGADSPGDDVAAETVEGDEGA